MNIITVNTKIRHYQFTHFAKHKLTKRLTLDGFSTDCEYLAICRDGSKNVEIWDTTTPHPLKTLEGHEQFVTSITFSMDGKYLATISGGDGTLLIWDVSSFKVLQVHKIEDYGPDDIADRCLMFSPNNNILAIMCENRICFLDWQAKTVVREIFVVNLWTRFDFVGNNHFLLFDECRHKLHIIDTNTFQNVYCVTKSNSDHVQNVFTSPQYIVIYWSEYIQILDAVTFQEVHKERHFSYNGRMIISRNGKYFATLDHVFHIIHIYEMSTFQRIRTYQTKEHVLDFMFSSDEKNLVILGNDGVRVTLS